jgi:pilus assembly protein CpaE
VAIDVTIIGQHSRDLEDILKASNVAAPAVAADLQRVAQAGAKLPRVVVLDLRKRPEIPSALASFKKDHPAVGVVIVAGKLEPTLMLEAMRTGVTEWVVDPVRATDLIPAVQRAAGTQAPTTTGEVFAVVGAKGGVGATTVAVNVATTLSGIGKSRTLLIDLRAATGDASLFLGAEPNFTILDALQNTHRLDEAFLKGIVVKTAAGPDLLASPDQAQATLVDPARLRAVVDAAARCYRFVVLDVPRVDVLFDDTLALAASITVVATQELAAIRAASRMAAELRQRHGADKVRVVINRYDRTADISSEDLERAVGGRIGHKFPSNYRLAIDALNKGRPIVVDNHNKLAASFASYARSLSGHVAPAADERPPAAAAPGIFGRLTGRR